MKFLDLMPEIRAGYAVTKQSWGNRLRQVYMGPDNLLVEKEFGHTKFAARVFSIRQEAADSDDWVVVKKGDQHGKT
jgi:hypothetical protein